MSVAIVGGHDRMVRRYREICERAGCSSKVFTQPRGDLAQAIGCPDLIVLFTEAVSHGMARQARTLAAANRITLVRSHCGSCNALRNILAEMSVKEPAAR